MFILMDEPNLVDDSAVYMGYLHSEVGNQATAAPWN